VTVTVNGSNTPCTLSDAQPAKIELTCSPAMPASATIHVDIATGFTATASGRALHDAAGATTMSVDLPPSAANTACRTWREMRVPTQ
jgi:hypothetical protein